MLTLSRKRTFSTLIENIKFQQSFFKQHGYAVLPEFFTHEETEEIQREMGKIIVDKADEIRESKAVFTTSEQVENLSKTTDYFLDSASKISFFYEEDAFDKDGNLKQNLEESLNKVGHAMHDLNSKFEKFCYSDKIKTICSDLLAYKSPVCVQTMYIFKSPKVGGEVNPH